VIRVTIEMVPMGVGKPRHIATIEIANDVDETISTGGRRGTYVARFTRISQRGERLGFYDRGGRVAGANRNQSGAVYRILHDVLDDFLKAVK
jgi:hypothetical protein